MLKTAISVPAIVPSAIMIDAYKKFVLVSLILSGQVRRDTSDLTARVTNNVVQTGQLPRYTSSGLQRHFRHACAPYEELATSFQTRSVADVTKCIEQNREAYVKDGNWGLVKQASKALVRKNIQRLTQTYLTLSLQDIADNVKLKSKDEAEKILLRMVRRACDDTST
jgi:COP9 signalosome complex subunit 3